LEDRSVPTVLADVAAALEQAPAVAAAAAELYSTALGREVDLIGGQLREFAGDAVAGVWAGVHVAGFDPDADVETAIAQLEAAGFHVEQLGTTPDEHGDLARISRTVTVDAASGEVYLGGHTGFGYFDDGVQGSLDGRLTLSSAAVTLNVTLGVDLVGGVPSFYVADTTRLQLAPAHGSAAVGGNLGIRNLLNVDVTGTAAVDVGAAVTLADADHKVRPGELSAPGTVRAAVAGTITLGGTLTSRLTGLGDLGWGFGGTKDLATGQTTFHLDTPDAGTVLRNLLGGLRGAAGGFKPLSLIGKVFNTQLPLVGGTLGEKLGVGGLTSLLSDLGSAAGQVNAVLAQFGITQHVTHPGVIDRVIRGERVDLLTFRTAGGQNWDFGSNYPVAAMPVGPFLVTVNSHINPYVGYSYLVGVGVDTLGVYIDPATHIEVHGGLDVGLGGEVSLAGILGIEAEVGAGVQVSAGLGLNDPDPTDGRIYLDEVARRGGNFAQGLLDTMTFHVGGEMYGYAALNLDLPWPIPDVTLFEGDISLGTFIGNDPADRRDTPVLTNSLRARSIWNDTPLPAGWLRDGTLYLDGTSAANDTVVLGGGTGIVTVSWPGKGKGQYAGVQKVVFRGQGGDDRLQALGGFDIPIDADGGEGDDQLLGGDAADTLAGGGGNDVVRGGGGADVLAGGDGNDQVRGGAGADAIDGGAGDDVIDADAGGDTVRGGAGRDAVNGGADADVLYGDGDDDFLSGGGGADAIDGGTGHDQLVGGSGTDTLVGGVGDDVLAGGADGDLVSGGDGNDLLAGDDGSDTLSGEAGDDVIAGGAGGDELHGGTGSDVLSGGDGSDLLWADDGNDTLDGGAGADELHGGGDNDRLAGGPGTDVVLGEAGDDVLYASAPGDPTANPQGVRDNLDGGAGRDQLFGSAGDDIILGGAGADDVFASSGNDVVTGGDDGATDTYWIDGTDGDDVISITGLGNGAQVQVNEVGAGQVQQLDVDAIGVRARGGNDSVTVYAGESLANKLGAVDGGDGNDVLDASGSPANVTLLGGAGNDTLLGAAGNDVLDGGAGDDSLVGGGNDVLVGSDGNDTIRAGNGNDAITGGDGGDDIDAGGGANTVEGGNGNDRIVTGVGNDTITGGAGNDTVTAGAGDDGVFGGDGNDSLSGGAGNDTLYGDLDADILRGEDGNDYLVGDTGGGAVAGDGNDTIHGGQGADTLCGQGGDDTLVGDTGDGTTGENDFLSGGWGADTLSGDGGNDTLQGGGGSDRLSGDVGNDYLAGDTRDGVTGDSDTLYGGRGADTLLGDGGNDYLVGDTNDPNVGEADTLAGGYGADTLIGSGGNDVLVEAYGPSLPVLSPGDASPNVLYGQAGDDRIYGGPGNDTLYGGADGDYLNDTWGQQLALRRRRERHPRRRHGGVLPTPELVLRGRVQSDLRRPRGRLHSGRVQQWPSHHLGRRRGRLHPGYPRRRLDRLRRRQRHRVRHARQRLAVRADRQRPPGRRCARRVGQLGWRRLRDRRSRGRRAVRRVGQRLPRRRVRPRRRSVLRPVGQRPVRLLLLLGLQRLVLVPGDLRLERLQLHVVGVGRQRRREPLAVSPGWG
jgi:Ca2+-binding RTX toxin-like protein